MKIELTILHKFKQIKFDNWAGGAEVVSVIIRWTQGKMPQARCNLAQLLLWTFHF